VEEQTILVLVQIIEANGTLQPTHDSRKSDRVDGDIVIAVSRWQDLLDFLLLVVLLGHLLLRCLLLGYLLPLESVKPSIQGFIVSRIPINFVLQFFNPLF
jgi:hypothetical protein